VAAEWRADDFMARRELNMDHGGRRNDTLAFALELGRAACRKKACHRCDPDWSCEVRSGPGKRSRKESLLERISSGHFALHVLGGAL